LVPGARLIPSARERGLSLCRPCMPTPPLFPGAHSSFYHPCPPSTSSLPSPSSREVVFGRTSLSSSGRAFAPEGGMRISKSWAAVLQELMLVRALPASQADQVWALGGEAVNPLEMDHSGAERSGRSDQALCRERPGRPRGDGPAGILDLGPRGLSFEHPHHVQASPRIDVRCPARRHEASGVHLLRRARGHPDLRLPRRQPGCADVARHAGGWWPSSPTASESWGWIGGSPAGRTEFSGPSRSGHTRGVASRRPAGPGGSARHPSGFRRAIAERVSPGEVSGVAQTGDIEYNPAVCTCLAFALGRHGHGKVAVCGPRR
jgi:hypothetical protein